MRKSLSLLVGVLLVVCFSACKSDIRRSNEEKASVGFTAPVLGDFCADSAYRYISEQVGFGPRVPGSTGHKNCKDYIVGKLRSFGVDSIIVQEAEVTAYNGDRLPIYNIIAGFNTEAKRRILLVAHWDTRPWADMEQNQEKRNQPILGANDGGSGVGVLLEIARNLGIKHPDAGIDLLFVDAEDYGKHEGFSPNTESWCLGTQYWVENMIPYNTLNKPVYGILLDMVGGKNARFHYEAFAKQHAPTATIKVWSEAAQLGYDNIFVRATGGSVTDDHVFITNAGIPTTNIIETNNEITESFPPTWHTHDDNMSNIDKKSLEAVGRTVLNVVYKEKAE